MRVKQTRSNSLVGMIVGLAFIGIGLFVVIPTFGTFGVFWTIMALIITGMNAYGFFNKKGMTMYELDMDKKKDSVDLLDEKLRKLKRMQEDGLLTEAEYEAKRQELLKQNL